MDTAAQIGAHITALTLTGLPYATGKLMGNAPQPVMRQFEIWGRAGKRGLPRVVRAYWKAISPLGITRPSTPGVPVLELVLYGQTSDGEAARLAHAAVAHAGKVAMATAGTVNLDDPMMAGVLTELGTHIKQFWRLYARTCEQAREQVVNGELGAAVICVRRNEAQILELVDVIETKSSTLAQHVGRTTTAQVDAILGNVLADHSYVQPPLESLTIPVRAQDGHGAPATPGPASPTRPATPSQAGSDLPPAQVSPKVERTAIQTSFAQHDEVDEAAARFAARFEEAHREDDQPLVFERDERANDLVEHYAHDRPDRAPDKAKRRDDERPAKGGQQWLGIIFVLLSLIVAGAVVYGFLYGLPSF